MPMGMNRLGWLPLIMMVAMLWSMGDRAIALDFQFSADETVVLYDDFDAQGDWQLSPGLQIEGGFLRYEPTASNTFAQASWVLTSGLNPLDGAINLYWQASFPAAAKTETNAYIPALQYAENPVFCWTTADNSVSLWRGPTCPAGTMAVREDAELRVWLRPQQPNNQPQTRLYVDPDFTPGVEPENRDPAQFPYVGLPNQGNQQQTYRLRLEPIENQYLASLAARQNETWQLIEAPLTIAPEQWRFVVGQDVDGYVYGAETAVTFEAVNILMRHDPARAEFTQIDGIALTQERSATITEPGAHLGFLAIWGFGATIGLLYCWLRQH